MAPPAIDGRPTWPFEPFYRFLYSSLPAWWTPTGILDVPALSAELGITTEAIYKWLRRGKVTARRARELYELSRRESNLAALADSGEAPPSLEAFYAFAD